MSRNICRRCGTNHNEDVVFCTSCGERVEHLEEKQGAERSVPEIIRDFSKETAAETAAVDPMPMYADTLGLGGRPDYPYETTGAADLQLGLKSEWDEEIGERPAHKSFYLTEDQPPLTAEGFEIKNYRVSVREYFWTTLLFCIPVVGLIAALVLAFRKGKNINRRNFASSSLILMLVAFIAVNIGFMATVIIATAVMNVNVGDYFKAIGDTFEAIFKMDMDALAALATAA